MTSRKKQHLQYSFIHRLTRDEYIEARSIFTRNTRSIITLTLAAVGIAFLFWEYTFVLGMGLLILFALYFFMPGILRSGMGEEYDRHEYLHYTLTYRFTDKGLSVVGENDLLASCSWNNHLHWREERGWIVITATGMPSLYVQAEDAKKNGAYEELMKRLNHHGNEFRPPEPLFRRGARSSQA